MRILSAAPGRRQSATTLPVIRAAVARQSEAVSGKARCGCPLEITRASRSV